ncbi:hypothetical protein FOZ61_007508 [Perkinsus olseni]|uniref:Uncharacterized protein n=1 Tax=Perkinsus olseni TaxID=32597 RepID=A0A7J6M8J7_PEROL|nr:hypothetical protein FOZ61_007508 [Perkinsus olseni]
MANANARGTEAFLAIMPASCPVVLRDAIIERLQAIDMAVSDIPVLVSKPEVLKRTVVDVLCPPAENETADQTQQRLVRGLRVEAALQEAAKASLGKQGPTAVSKRYGGAASPGLVADQATVKLIAESPSTYREIKLGADCASLGKKPVLDVNGAIQWIPETATAGRQPKRLCELLYGLLPVLLCVDVSVGLEAGPWILQYVQQLCRICMVHGEAAVVGCDVSFRRSLSGRAFALAEREKISLSLATIRLLGNAVDQEALNEATRTLTPAVGAQSSPGSATTSSTSTSSPSADEKGKHVPPGDCPPYSWSVPAAQNPCKNRARYRAKRARASETDRPIPPLPVASFAGSPQHDDVGGSSTLHPWEANTPDVFVSFPPESIPPVDGTGFPDLSQWDGDTAFSPRKEKLSLALAKAVRANVVWKDPAHSKIRIIKNYRTSGVNHASRMLTATLYPGLPQIRLLLREVGPGSALAEFDVTSAFRTLQPHPLERRFLALRDSPPPIAGIRNVTADVISRSARASVLASAPSGWTYLSGTCYIVLTAARSIIIMLLLT